MKTEEKTDGSYGIERKRTAEEYLHKKGFRSHMIMEYDLVGLLIDFASQFKVGEEVIKAIANSVYEYEQDDGVTPFIQWLKVKHPSLFTPEQQKYELNPKDSIGE